MRELIWQDGMSVVTVGPWNYPSRAHIRRVHDDATLDATFEMTDGGAECVELDIRDKTRGFHDAPHVDIEHLGALVMTYLRKPVAGRPPRGRPPADRPPDDDTDDDTDDYLATFAAVYVAAPPNRRRAAVADTYGVSESTVTRWVNRARSAGLIPNNLPRH